MPPKQTAGAALRQMREAAGIPLGELASQAGVSSTTLSRFETGTRELAPATYAHTLKALGILIAGRAA